ncbi:MAG: tripartite tricarboxylate transporter permease [Clostridia bacterium]
MEWITGLLTVLNPSVLLFLFVGVIVGLFVGALPGLSATMAIAILTPLTFWFEPAQGFAMLIGVWNSAIFAGGISAILINTPGTPASIATTFDGYDLYKRGQGGLALGINVIYSALGGLVSTIALIFLSFPLARFAIKFGPSEYFALALFGLTMMITVSENSVVKGLIVGFAGLLISTIGIDPILSLKRFTFNSKELVAGISFLPIMIGMFGIGEVLTQIFDSRKKEDDKVEREKAKNLELGRILPNKQEYKMLAKPTFIAAIIATIVGAIPATGGDIASIICWGQAKKMSKHPEEYGKGSLEGLAVSCTANNGVIGGALTTMLTLGIPGDTVSAILIGSLMMYGMQPGPRLFTENKPFVINLMLLMILANIAFVIIGLLTARASSKVLNVAKQTVWVSVTILCIVGAYALNNSYFDIVIMAAAGILGFFFRKGGFAPGPFILGLLLGNMLESNFRRTLVMSQGSLSVFFIRPITLVLILLIAFSLLYPLVKDMIKNKKLRISQNEIK